MIEAQLPDFLNVQERNAFCRIYQRLNRQGLWREEYLSPLAAACQTCSHYLMLAKKDILDSEIEETRLQARQMIADFYYISHDRVNLAVINSDGIDSDIADLCKPL
jgi:hypothetical protein